MYNENKCVPLYSNINKMRKYFVTYDIATSLKELNFNEKCLAYYTKDFTNLDKNGNKTNFILLSAKLRGELVGHGSVKNELFKWLKANDKTNGELYTLSNSVTAPLYQQVFDWFRKKYNLDGSMSVDVWNKKTVSYRITGGIKNVIEANSYGALYDIDSKDYDSYEEAKIECVKELISILNKNNKLEMDMDLRIIGFNYGNKGTKNENVISVLQLESECGKLKTAPGGMTEAMMADVTARQEELMGTVVQIRCCGLSETDKGWSTQHPSIVELRTDKDTCDTLESCIEIENMAKTLKAK